MGSFREGGGGVNYENKLMKSSNLDINYNHAMICYCFMKISLNIALFRRMLQRVMSNSMWCVFLVNSRVILI